MLQAGLRAAARNLIDVLAGSPFGTGRATRLLDLGQRNAFGAQTRIGHEVAGVGRDDLIFLLGCQ